MAEPSIALTEIIYTDASKYFDRILDAIQSAAHSIEMEVYLYHDDQIGTKITQALCEAAKRGVTVKLLTDGVGICSNFHEIADKLLSSGVQVKIYRPLPWRFELWPLSRFPKKGILKLWHLMSYINQRNHRKLLVIDNLKVWLGSFNISQTHLSINQGGENWRDTAIELTGIDTRNLGTAFNACWFKYSKRSTAGELSPSPFIFNFTRSLRLSARSGLLHRIKTAKERVWITNAYFIPDTKLLNALVIASKNGADVRIVLPKQSDIFFIPWASSYFYSHLLDAGIRLYEYHNGVLHTKTVLIDHWGSVGSSNLNSRSLMHDLELDYSVQTEESKRQLTHDFVDDLKKSEELDQENWNQHRLWQRALGGLLLFLFGYWV